MTMTATYSPDDNKLRLYSVERLDAPTYARACKLGFRYAPRQELFVAPAWTPAREDFLIELCGEIGDDDTSLTDRAETRAERFEDYQAKRAAEADAARATISRITDGIPFGQPILVGHHSERRARKDAERIENGMRNAVRLWDTSQYWKDRAAGALAHAAHKESPDVRARRIKTIEADARKMARSVAELETAIAALSVEGLTYEQAEAATGISVSYGLWTELRDAPEKYLETCAKYVAGFKKNLAGICVRWAAHYENRLTYERAMLAEQGGLAADKFDIVPGGEVFVRGSWYKVVRVNKRDGKAISVTTNSRFVSVRGMEEINDYRAPSAEVAAAASDARKLPPLCNYPGEGFLHMTKAEWDATHSDYKGSRELGHGAIRAKGHRPDIKGAAVELQEVGRHRVRVVVRGGLVPVFLTDSKVTKAPPVATVEKTAAPEQSELLPVADIAPAVVNIAPEVAEVQRPASQPVAAYVDPDADNAKAFEALRKGLRAGVQVVSAPQLFPTPPELAARMVELAGIMDGDRVLEPSAGTGRLVQAVRDTGAIVHIVAVEVNRPLADQLHAFNANRGDVPQEVEVIARDFLELKPGAGSDGCIGAFDAVVMNPPFVGAQDIQHIRHALAMVKPGGRLVALCANGPRQNEQLRPLVAQYRGEWEVLPAGSFAESGTAVNVALLTLRA